MPITLTSPLADMIIGVPVRLQVSDTSGSPGYAWDIPPGSILPPGLQLSSDLGFIYGVPTIAGQYLFYVREKIIATGDTAQRQFIVEVKRESGTVTQVINNNTTIVNEPQPSVVTVDSVDNWVRVGNNLPFRFTKEAGGDGTIRYKLSILNDNNEVIDVGYTDWN